MGSRLLTQAGLAPKEAAAYDALLRNGNYSNIYNVGYSKGYSVLEIVNAAKEGKAIYGLNRGVGLNKDKTLLPPLLK